jgi:hypothetical protein
MENYLKKRCGNLFNNLQKIIKYCKCEWEGPLLPFLPKHGIKHSEKLLYFIEDILPMIKPPLSMDELYIIVSSIYIHDLGLQEYEILENKGIIKSSNVSELNIDDQKRILDNHRIIIPDIVNKMISDSRCGHFPHHDIIAGIASEHKNSDDCIYPEFQEIFGGESIRYRMLIALLQCVDALHISSDRVDMKHINKIPLNSRKYWWEMYYIREVIINLNTKRIRFHYEIPPEFEEHMDIFKQFTEKRFKRFPGDAMDILWDYGVYLQVGGSIPWVMTSNNKKMMPHIVINDIKKYLEIKNLERVEKYKETIKKFARDISDLET